ncbi:MAG: metallophosphoesterase, partial [Bacteroidales bacterium]|nr:metallophosphoesterase [Bacteroidales bacterium]
DQSTSGNVDLSFSGNFTFSGIEDLIKLNFIPLISGETDLEFYSAFLNGIEVEYLSSGNIYVNSASEATGDTITIIQRPLLNIPAIVVPGEELDIICVAPESTTGWQADLLHEGKIINLEMTQSFYDNDLQRWYMKALIPQPEIFELYDLGVTASGNIQDITKDAVQLIPQLKDSYYFVHITDTHLPTHLYYDDPQYEGDSTEMDDLREVIKDINLINPEFVLLTGDFVNEGELEDFQNRRYYTKAQRMLTEFKVPVYLVSGNHDLGGWIPSPPPQGTARNDWWRFFGWPWLIDPPASEPYYTQDYSFDYGTVHYIGLESYDNYDGYMYYIYGNESFIPSQLIWLDNDLQNSTGSESRVLFYHFDFADQLNLSSLGVDMALWGHIHHNSGSIYSQPYNLATNNVCDEERSYRVIRVDNGDLQAEYTISAGVNGENMNVNFYPANNGLNDSVSADISNNHNLTFANGMVKFIMPKGEYGYSVNNGVLKQVDKSGQFAICYVKVNIPATDTKTVSVKIDTSLSVRFNNKISPVTLYQNYPNPFCSETTIRFWLQQPDYVSLEIFDISGKIVRTLINEEKMNGYHSVIWNGKDDKGKSVTGRVFIYKLQTKTGFIEIKRMIKL